MGHASHKNVDMTKKRSQKAAESEAKVTDAISLIKNNVCPNANQAAKATSASRSTVYRHLDGGRTRSEARGEQQNLTPDEENALVAWILELSKTGYPVRLNFLREMAEEIRKPRLQAMGKVVPPLGKSWSQRFVARHPQIETVRSRNIEAARIKDVSVERIQIFFAAFIEAIQKYGISPENMYNMDETGITDINPNYSECHS